MKGRNSFAPLSTGNVLSEIIIPIQEHKVLGMNNEGRQSTTNQHIMVNT